jgi:hypothetical protein
MEPRLECTIRKPEYACRIGDVLIEEVEENHRLPISARKRTHHPPDQRFPPPGLEALERIAFNGCTVALFQRQFLHRVAPGRGPEDVQRHCIQPRRELCIVAPLMKTRERAQEGLLRHVFRLATMSAEPVGQVDQRPLPALDDPGEGIGIAREDPTNIGAVGIVRGGHPFTMRHTLGSSGCAIFIQTKMQPGLRRVCHIHCHTRRTIMDAGAAVMLLGLFAFLAVTAWASSQRDQREMKYRYELYQRMVEHPGPEANVVRALLERDIARRQAAEIADKRMGGFVTLAVGIGLGTFLYYLVPHKPVYLVGLVPGLVGVVILIGALRAQSANGGSAR